MTVNVANLTHDAYKKNYGVTVTRILSVDRLKSLLIGEEIIDVENAKDKSVNGSIISAHFNLHPQVGFERKGNGVILKLREDKKMLFTPLTGKLFITKSTYIGNYFEPQYTSKLIVEQTVEETDGKLKWMLEEVLN